MPLEEQLSNFTLRADAAPHREAILAHAARAACWARRRRIALRAAAALLLVSLLADGLFGVARPHRHVAVCQAVDALSPDADDALRARLRLQLVLEATAPNPKR